MDLLSPCLSFFSFNGDGGPNDVGQPLREGKEAQTEKEGEAKSRELQEFNPGLQKKIDIIVDGVDPLAIGGDDWGPCLDGNTHKALPPFPGDSPEPFFGNEGLINPPWRQHHNIFFP